MKSVNEEDLKDVAQWLNTEIENVEITYQKESIKLYENAAKEMYDSYDEFPRDKKRTEKIIKLLKKGEKLSEEDIQILMNVMFLK